MKALAISFYGSTDLHIRAVESTGWCDAYYLRPDKLVGGIAGSIEELQNLNIDYGKYDAALIFQDSLVSVQKYFVEQCVQYGLTVYANQHGFNKSIHQIVEGAPNLYSKYWNCTGQYFLDRFRQVVGTEPLNRRWISIGSLVHDYLYKNYRWDKRNNNGKALIIHEPDLRDCEGDIHPHDSETITSFVISELHKAGIPADFKPHPNWKNFIGNSGKPLKKPRGVPVVDIKVEEIVNYAMVIGSRSSMLLEAAVMGIPTLAVESTSSWDDDKYPPVEEGERGLIPTYSRKNFKNGLAKHFNITHKYDLKKLQYYCGPFGHIALDYRNFIEKDLEEPDRVLGKTVYNDWKKGIGPYSPKTDSISNLRLRLNSAFAKFIKRDERNTVTFQKSFWAKKIAESNNDKKNFYGYDWGDPNKNQTKDCDGKLLGNYLYIKNHYLLPGIKGAVVLEIGSGGAKWTQYMKQAKKVICVDLADEIFAYIKKRLKWKNLEFYKTSGSELRGVKSGSVDLAFSMDSLVRTSKPLLKNYFSEISRVLKVGGKICLHLPCDEAAGSRMRDFVKLSTKDIESYCRNNSLKIIDIDNRSITHGVILLAEKYV